MKCEIENCKTPYNCVSGHHIMLRTQYGGNPEGDKPINIINLCIYHHTAGGKDCVHHYGRKVELEKFYSKHRLTERYLLAEDHKRQFFINKYRGGK